MTRRTTIPDAAKIAGPLFEKIFGRVPMNFEFWDGSNWPPKDTVPKDTIQKNCIANIRLRSADALRQLLWSPNELGMARAFVTGEIEVEGDLFETLRELRSRDTNLRRGLQVLPRVIATAFRLGIIGRPLPPPPEEMHPRGKLHSVARDAKVVRHHYDVSNDFYRIVLGSSMTYSCGLFGCSEMSLVDAQTAKNDLVCRKLGLHERSGMRLLDVGCGWGSLALHAASHYDARVVGVTISREQFKAATRLVEQAGLAGRVDIRLEDYRQLRGERFDAIASIGMSEHVGKAKIGEYFSTLTSLLSRQGRLLNHAISSVGGSKLGRHTFMYRYVFPDGELLDVGDTVLAMEDAGLEVRDVDSLREHYALTLRAWVANLEAQWDAAVAQVGVGRARVWRLYMAGSAVGFEVGDLGIHQVLGVLPTTSGTSGIDLARKFRSGL